MKKIKVNKTKIKVIALIALVIVLVGTGVVGTLKYQEFIRNTQEQAVNDYIADYCNLFSNESGSEKWYECRIKR